ncbi:MAG: glycosyltransferase family 2 protein [Deltaproteobacteria bacterium]|nr:glycosyltransferase family 2 protein [Deltaproteobacteria bacterium]
MKLIIQIPCYNEEATLGKTLGELPRAISDIDTVEWLVIDDGSTDDTVGTARKHGVDHIVCLPRHQGLARAFMVGLESCLKAGADIIVNTDADNQYCADDIPKLIQPILQGEAEMVIGARPIESIEHFSGVKKVLQRAGSWVVRIASRSCVADAPSGFRAISREAAVHLNVFSEYTYTLETVIQAGQKNMAVASVPIRVNKELRPSRLVKSIPSYVYRSVSTIVRIFMTYKPMRFFFTPAIVLFTMGFVLGLRFLYYYAMGQGGGKVQSLILVAILILMGFQLGLFGLIADLISVNRKLMEEVQWRLRKREFGGGQRTEKDDTPKEMSD